MKRTHGDTAKRGHFKSVALVFFLSSAVVGWSPLPSWLSAAEAASTARAFVEPGADVLRHLQSRYADTAQNCGTATAPAFVCSGIMIRATSVSTNYHSWDVNMSSPKAPGVSFTWLRRDAAHVRLITGLTAGFIFYPKKFADSHGLRAISVLCAFPIDGATDARDAKGCGPSTTYPAASGPCQAQGINDAAGWRQNFDGVSGIIARMHHQCGFTVVSGTPNSAAAFMETVRARAQLDLTSYDGKPNELVIDGWPLGADGTLPIEAFFYTTGTATGLSNAQFIQRDFHSVTGRWVAIIAVTFPATQTGTVTFAYHPADQAIPQPRARRAGNWTGAPAAWLNGASG